MENLWGKLNATEVRCLYDSPGVIENQLFISALRAKLTGVSEKTLSDRLAWISKYMELPRLDRPLWEQWKKLCVFSIIEIDKPIRKPKKYSGYIKSPSAAGGKHSHKVHPDPGIFEWSSVSEKDYFRILTVGEYIGESLVLLLPDDEPNRFETVEKIRK